MSTSFNLDIDVENLFDEEEEELTSSSDSPVEEEPEVVGLEFPCVIIDGLTTQIDAEFVLTKVNKGEDLLPLYVMLGEEPRRSGNFSLNLDNIRLLSYMKLGGWLYTPDERKIDLSDTDTWYNFIRRIVPESELDLEEQTLEEAEEPVLV